jgi:hypothetical protein
MDLELAYLWTVEIKIILVFISAKIQSICTWNRRTSERRRKK